MPGPGGSRRLDTDLAAKLARRLMRCEGRPCRHASASSETANTTADSEAEDDDIDAQIRRRRPDDDGGRGSGGGGCAGLCPQLALKLASRLEKSESCDSGVSVASSSFCLTAAPAPPVRGTASGDAADSSRSLPASRRNSLEAEFPALPRRELLRLRDLFFAAQLATNADCCSAGGERRLPAEAVGRLLERLGVPLTHLALRAALRELDAASPDGRVGFRGFLALLGRARAVAATAAAAVAAAVTANAGGDEDDGLMPAWIDASTDVASVPVEEVGVREARCFFESQIAALRPSAPMSPATRSASSGEGARRRRPLPSLGDAASADEANAQGSG